MKRTAAILLRLTESLFQAFTSVGNTHHNTETENGLQTIIICNYDI